MSETSPSAGDPYPYVHVGHGVSAARKSWAMIAVLRDPLPEKIRTRVSELFPPPEEWAIFGEGTEPDRIPVPGPLVLRGKRGKRRIELSHNDDALPWMVAAFYPYPGPRVDQGEATSEQWRAFNEDLDETLARIHERWPIEVVIRPIDDEYSTSTSS